LRWRFEDGVFIISGVGDMRDFLYTNDPWEDIKNEVQTITIQEGVTSIGNHAFCDMTSLLDISIAGSVKRIGYGAFSDCNNLRSVVVPDGIKTIENSTFGGCESMISITIPRSVTHIEAFAFIACSNLEDVYYGGSKNEWEAVNIEWYEDGALPVNNSLRGATIHHSTPS